MLVIHDPEHFRDVVTFATQVGALDQFMSRVLYLGTYAHGSDSVPDSKCELGRDFAPYSFSFVVYRATKLIHQGGEWVRWFNGGLIYSGPGLPSDGSAPSLTVSLNRDAAAGAVHMWSTHT